MARDARIALFVGLTTLALACGPTNGPHAEGNATAGSDAGPTNDSSDSNASAGASSVGVDDGADTTGFDSSGSSSTGLLPNPDCVDVIEGDLIVDETVTDLDALRTVRVVTGKVSVTGRDDIANLEFLECLEEVGSSITIFENANLTNLQGLRRLNAVGTEISHHGLHVGYNPALVSLAGLDSLQYAASISINGNASLAHLDLQQLKSVSALTFGGCSQRSEGAPAMGSGSNPSLVAIDGLDSLGYTQFIAIEGQENLVSIDHLIELVENGADLSSIEAKYNPNLAIEDLEAYMAALGFPVSEEQICGNLGGAPECVCWTVGE